jgi:predicted amidophosphoribosyltransferase
MQEVFACQTGDLTNQKVLLIDDVATTGTTLNACATALKQANVASVWGLTVARES